MTFDKFRYVTIRRLAALTGYSEKAIRRKIEEGVFIYGKHYIKSPDGRIQFDIEEYEKWVESRARKLS